MAITIFEDHDCSGKSRAINKDVRDLKGDPVDKPGSIRLTDDNDAVLLFMNDDWHGGALYIRGRATVTDLGAASEGGRTGFGNATRSIRVTPFQVDLNVTVVKDAKGRLPGAWKTEAEARASIRAMVQAATDFFVDKRALLQLAIARITFRTSDSLFAISSIEQILLPGEWTERGECDVIFVDRFTKEGTIGRATFPCWGQAVVVAGKANKVVGRDENQTVDEMSAVMVHEIGHHFGLAHGTANTDQNLMWPTLVQGSLRSMWLTPDQIREMHDRLANNISRKDERKDPRPGLANPTP